MKKRIDPITINYIYDANRNNAHYSFDGEKFMNGGEFAECVDKFVRGYAQLKMVIPLTMLIVIFLSWVFR